MDPMDAIRQTYFQECEELLQALEEGLLAIECGDANSETINGVFRAVHSIKGGAGAFGFDAMVAFAHIYETALDHLRDGSLAASPHVTRILLRAADMLSDHVSAARSNQHLSRDSDRDITQELESLYAASNTVRPNDPINMPDQASPISGWSIHFRPHSALYAKGNDPFFLLRELAGLGPIDVTAHLGALPEFDLLDPEDSHLSWTIQLPRPVREEDVREIFEFAEDDCDLTLTPQHQKNTDLPLLQDAEQSDTPLAPRKDAAETTVKPTIRVDLDKVDRLVNLVGELVITQAMLSQRMHECKIPRTSSVASGLDELDHLLRELQESVMAIRTQPVKSVFQRMPRLVRELADQTGKQVHLTLEGENTEVDKTVIERLGEPLTHMIRNAIDHGLETPEERRAAGKPPEGQLTLAAEHRSGRILIEISDDGRGIDRARVREKAIERKLISPNASLSDEETDNLIFLPGFSTAKEISNISGRGVGMDVVRRNIVDLGGRIIITSHPGKGSTFSLTLPLTLAVLDGMVVAVGDQTFVLPLTHIVESLKPRREDIHPFGARRQLLNVRGAYVPLIHTGNLLGARDATDANNGVVILVESQGTGRLALLVDSIIGQSQVVIKSFENNYQHIEGIAAATILGDGRVALILDVDGLVSYCRAEISANTTELELRPTGT